MQKVYNFVQSHTILFLILVLSFCLRIVLVNEVPPSLNWDEISHGYNAYSILNTGSDEWGKFMPIIFRAYGDYKLPVYIYTTVLSVAVFGLNALAVRLPSIIAGCLTVFFTYLLTYELFKTRERSKKIALWSAFLVAISPWTFFISRGAFEANLSLTFITAGIYFFLLGRSKPSSLCLSAIFLGLSVWTYNSARVFVPLILVFLCVLCVKDLSGIYKKHKNLVFLFGFLIILFFAPMFYQLLNPVGQARYDKVAILQPAVVYQIEQARNESKLSPLLNRLQNNRVTFFTSAVVKNWTKHYTPEFLFLNGGTQYQFSVPGRGLIYIVLAPFLIFGLINLLKLHDKSSLLILGWFLLGPIASSVTSEAPHVLRSVTMLPVPMLLIALGIVVTFEWFKSSKYLGHISNLLPITFVFVFFLSLEKYGVEYFTNYKNNYSWSWQYGYKEVVEYARDNYNSYDAIVVTKKYGEPHEFFLFFNQWDPENFRNDQNLIRYTQSDWFWVDRFDKYWFVNDWQIQELGGNKFITESENVVDCSTQRCMLITSPNNAPLEWKKVNTVKFLDKSVAFEIYEN